MPANEKPLNNQRPLERYAQRYAEQAGLLEPTAGYDSATLETGTAPEGRVTH
ncbi:MAG: hypothetical protein AB1671_26665 [Thermodesulfobacteriota bacterium]